MKEIEDANQNKSDGSDDSSGEEQDGTESDASSSSFEELKVPFLMIFFVLTLAKPY